MVINNMNDESTNAIVREIRGALQSAINRISPRIHDIITKPYKDEIDRLKEEIDRPRHDERRKERYDRHLKLLLEFDKKFSRLVEDSKSRGRGAFGWMDENPEARVEWDVYHALQYHLSREYLILNGMDKDTVHGKLCIDCGALRYGTAGAENGRWYCQEECEDK